jgi:hypothetical protein
VRILPRRTLSCGIDAGGGEAETLGATSPRVRNEYRATRRRKKEKLRIYAALGQSFQVFWKGREPITIILREV